MTSDADALVLDFGGVITRTLFETHDITERSLGLPAGTLTWMGPFDPDNDPLWQRMQADEISEREYWQERIGEVGRLIGEQWSSINSFMRRARAVEPAAFVRPEAVVAIEEVKAAGKRVAVLSNELDLFYGPEFRERLPLMDAFDVVVDASYTKILKPDPRAYRLLLEAIDLPAASCVFLDDQQRNIEGARAIGMRAVHFDVRDARASYNTALTMLGLPIVL